MTMKPIKVFTEGVVEVNDVKYCFSHDSAQRLKQYQDEQNKNISNQCKENIERSKSELENDNLNIDIYNQIQLDALRLEQIDRNYALERAIERQWDKKKIHLNITKCEKISIYIGLLCVEYEDGYNNFIVLGKDCDSFRHYYDVKKAFPVKSL